MSGQRAASDEPIRDDGDTGAGTGTGTDRGTDTARGATERPDTDSETVDSTDDAGPVTLTRKPTVFSSACALGAALVAVVMAALVPEAGVPAIGFGALGIAILGLGLARGQAGSLDVGALVLFFGLVAGGIESNAVEPLVVGTIATVLAWDLGHSAVDLGSQLGREARTIRLELVQFVSSLLVGLVAGTIGYAVYVLGAGGQSAGAIVLLLLAAAFITIGLGTKRKNSVGRQSRRKPPR